MTPFCELLLRLRSRCENTSYNILKLRYRFPPSLRYAKRYECSWPLLRGSKADNSAKQNRFCSEGDAVRSRYLSQHVAIKASWLSEQRRVRCCKAWDVLPG